MCKEAGEMLDEALNDINIKLDLLANHLGLEFDYSGWGEVDGLKEMRDE